MIKSYSTQGQSYRLGKRAGEWGFLPADNPFMPGSKESRQWNLGCCNALIKPEQKSGTPAFLRRHSQSGYARPLRK